MNKTKHVKGQVSLLVTAILVLCAGFLIIGCGSKSDPQSKSKENNKGAFAVDFSKCPFEICFVDAQGSSANPYPSMEGEEFTIEAWVKNKTNPSLSGIVFSHMDSAGAALFVNRNVPKFAIRRLPVASDVETSRSLLTECARLGAGSDVTSTECVVQALDKKGLGGITAGVATTLTIPNATSTAFTVSAVSLLASSPTTIFTDSSNDFVYEVASPSTAISVPETNLDPGGINTSVFNMSVTTSGAHTLAKNVWTHIAGVLTTEDQGNGPNNCAADPDGNGTNQGEEIPHLAIYIDGTLSNCATSGEVYADDPGDRNKLKIAQFGDTVALDNLGDDSKITSETQFNGVIDEVRVWGYARTQKELKQCMYKELAPGGACDLGDPRLVSYYRFNEGEGEDAADFSGIGFKGTLLGIDDSGHEPEFVDGWVKGNPDLKPAD